jgi:hypothetical protein
VQHKVKGSCAKYFTETVLANALQFPQDEVKDFEKQLFEIQAELNAEGISHEGKTAEEVYAERLAAIQLCEGVVQDGPTVVKSLLARCLLWVEVIETRCDCSQSCFIYD